jgi:hypothetical protein
MEDTSLYVFFLSWLFNDVSRPYSTDLYCLSVYLTEKLSTRTILPAVLHGHAIWSHTLSEEQRLKILMGVFGLKQDKETE